MTASVEFKNHSRAWLQVQEMNLNNALNAMGDAIMKNAMITAPKLTGKMRNSSRVKKVGTHSREIIFGGGDVPYAHYQETGGNGKIKHYTTPGTGAHYLENAGNAVTKQGIGMYL